MKLTNDESRALAFIAGLLLLSAAVRIAAAREPVDLPPGGIDLAAHVEATRAAVAEAERAARPLGAGERIDPNAADAAELDRLPGVGPALAARIVAWREEHGPFGAVDDLRQVRGIGDRLLQDLAPVLALPTSMLDFDGRTRARDGGRWGARAPGRWPSGEPVDVNRASAEQLTTLPGIGPSLAARIVAWRDSAGPFAAVDSLVVVRGIGPATVAGLRDRATVR